ncbi:FAD:protein FMN transferase [Pseudoprimorskyibacter insulae]|uniref:FAD:protein FMN transferase n=1 Tax=Pseudoprimorskyibacter insulae TaxID=1695997 RepID=A0A2R8B0A7_9RHOB|nr:FAD:protein FMN transferase [Pseudoprimorskyibacter insulae]SPF81703.1 hypothetical protein PRI8871_03528 [Pseudoprimorskyibacter insulae]
MSLTRRRFLSLFAAATALPGAAQAMPTTWTGRAFGAEVSISLRSGGPEVADHIAQVVAEMRRIEALFSIYDAGSELSRLNRAGEAIVSADMVTVLNTARQVYRATGGAFDPSVQPLWAATSLGGDASGAADLVGFDRVQIAGSHVSLGQGQALTLNGIAQGFAADRITALLRRLGYQQALVNMGEHSAIGGPYRLGLSDPEAGHLGHLSLTNASMATSSPGAMQIGSEGHILHPVFAPQWATVTVEAPSAALADAASTALCLLNADQTRKAKRELGLSRVVLVDEEGSLTTL